MKTILIQQVYPNHGFLPLIQEQFVRNTNYCEKFEIDYTFISATIKPMENGGWDKVYHIFDAFSYDLIVWLDADAIIYDTNVDLKSVPLLKDSVGAVMFGSPVPHLNVGVMYVKPGKQVTKLFQKWIGMYPGQGAWREQGVFNAIKNECVTYLPSAWNKNYDYNPYSHPVVMGFHGFGEPEKRVALMREVLNGTKPEKSESG